MADYPNAVGSPARGDHPYLDPPKKILVVDDDDDTRALLRAVLEKHSFEVDEAENTRQALAKVESWEPDLVTTDISRPDDTGLQLLFFIMGRRRSLPVVFITASIACREMCRVSGAAAFIPKPFDPEQLIEVVREALSRSHSG